MKKMAGNVVEFLNKASGIWGRLSDDMFNQSVFTEMHEQGVESPIEQFLFIALRLIIKTEDLYEVDPEIIGDDFFLRGVEIKPQYQIDKYRVDFLVSYHWIKWGKDREPIQTVKSLIVECDSQAFHERTEKERRYEKMRDRYFIKRGYRVFHYTGSEIVKNPIPLAVEILSEVCGYDMSEDVDGTIENYGE